MPTTVKGPDGKTYTVNAPPGTTDAQVMAYVRRQVEASRKADTPTTWDEAHGALSTFLDGGLPGAGGVLSGVAGAVMNPMHPVDGFTGARRASERHEERFKQDHPYIAPALTAAGFVGSLALPVTKLGLVAKGAEAALEAGRAAKVTLGGRALNSAINGGIYGAAGGALDSHAGSGGEFARDVARGGALGGAVGGALPIAGRFAAPIVAPAASAATRKLAPAVAAAGRAIPGAAGRNLQNRAQMMGMDRADVRASRYVGNKLTDAQMDPAQLMTELQRRHALGVPAAPADTHEALRDAYGSAARRPGPATSAVRKAIDDRQREMTRRVSGHIEDTLGPATNVEAHADALNRQAEEDAAPLYAISDAHPIPLVNELKSLFNTPSGKKAMQIAGSELLDQRVPLKEYGLVQGKDGVFSIGKAPTMKFYDYMKRTLDTGVFKGDTPFASEDVSSFGRGARQIRKDLLGIMDGDGTGPRIPGTDMAPAAPTGAPSGPDVVPGAPEAPQLPSPVPQGLPQAPPRPALPQPPQGPAGESAGALVPQQAPQVPGALGSGLPVPYEAPGGLGAHGADLPAIPHPDEPFEGVDYGQRLDPQEPIAPQAQAPRQRRTSAIPPEGLNPYWKPAREAFAGPTQNRKALELGQQMAKDDAVDAANRMDGMTNGSQRDFFRLGHRTGLAQDVRNLGDYGNAARRVDGNMDARTALRTVHGPEAADNLMNRLAAEHEGYQTWAAVRGNSMTAGREASDEIAKQEQALADTGRGLWAFAQGRTIDGAKHIASAFSGEPALTNRVNDLTASKLGSTDLDAVRNTLGDVRRVRAGDAATAKTADRVQKQVAKAAGARAGSSAATPDSQVLLGYGHDEASDSYYPVYGEPGSQLAAGLIPANL